MTRRGLDAFGVDRERGPCHATYHNVFKGLDIDALERALSGWVRACGGEEALGHVAIDGKTLRGSGSLEGPGVHLLAAYSEALKGVVEELEVPQGTNEITTALKLLRSRRLDGALITGDAIFTQKEICKEIVEGGGDYFFVVKGNQPGLKSDIEAIFDTPSSPLTA